MQSDAELTTLRGSLHNGRPFGTSEWTERIAERLNIELIPFPGLVPARKN
jgi:hypothetical protein